MAGDLSDSAKKEKISPLFFVPRKKNSLGGEGERESGRGGGAR